MSCCGGKCGCGPNCGCGSSCNGCGMYPDIETSNTQSLIFGVAPQQSFSAGSEMGAEGGGCGSASCNCGSDCQCGSDCKC
ncbi:hypothetical protein MKW98_008580 [Papaver atlanticum]|uniref:Metallothionein-like protein n=1 Tax=Papaver atlanticum TaxID=357466 RepID=A0AAD4TCY1_9MAGN|nr:hypothetical protein MKW98_008580 [Papaver atlanticum]